MQAVATGSATLSWNPPTTNTDGSPLTNLAGYKVYWGTTPGNYSSSATIMNPGIATYVVESLTPNTYYFAVTARQQHRRGKRVLEQRRARRSSERRGGRGGSAVDGSGRRSQAKLVEREVEPAAELETGVVDHAGSARSRAATCSAMLGALAASMPATMTW